MYETSSGQRSGNLAGNAAAAGGPNRRREPRFAVSGPCHLVWNDNEHEVCACGVIQDISVSGLRVRTRLRAETGSNIHVFVGERSLIVGEVRHCTENADGTCDIGILIRATVEDPRRIA